MALFGSLSEIDRNRKRLRRRRFLTTSVAGVACFLGYRWWKFRAKPLVQRETPFITPVSKFFTTSINPAFRPEIKRDTYTLEVAGPKGTKLVYSLDEVRTLEAWTTQRTLVCVGNSIGGRAVGNAEWKVTPLAPILDRVVHGSDVSTLHVTFHGLDGFYSSVPYDIAADPDTVLAYEMNGRDLTPLHGFPLRVLIPGKYGMKQPRWLTRIVIGSEDEGGYWERRGWSDACEIRSFSRIDSAKGLKDGSWEISGIAFCGRFHVDSVEISLDDGESWRAAELIQVPLKNRWTQWKIKWQPPAPGEYVVAARVRDSNGLPQDETNSGSFPSGSTGFHRVIVNVV